MSTQFLVKSRNNKCVLDFKTILYDGAEVTRLNKGGLTVLEILDPDVTVEVVVRRRVTTSGSGGLIGDVDEGETNACAADADVATHEPKKNEENNTNESTAEASHAQKPSSVEGTPKIAEAASVELPQKSKQMTGSTDRELAVSLLFAVACDGE
jgi:hypothetical protein